MGIDGSIDWLCLPHFDSPSCFARLLGDENARLLADRSRRGHRTSIVATRRWYRPDSLVLETEFDTATGTVRITDCMPMRDEPPARGALGRRGVAAPSTCDMELAVRFDYGEVVPWVTTRPRA